MICRLFVDELKYIIKLIYLFNLKRKKKIQQKLSIKKNFFKFPSIASGRNRTTDLVLTRHMLYQLSHRGNIPLSL
jgi:hypothetical protein